ncbi:MAG TPA: dsDNA nuclease domain-containing protein [Candidatus Angelobacter sp.]|nr:dsDNA nuclease domain-containing protein [Candidatus Angelobacter sp.]
MPIFMGIGSPSEILSNSDPGDDMQRRLRYQAAYGAILSLQTLDSSDVLDVFCEHHEDFLVRKANGKYLGVQVKTREPHLGPFKADDAAVINALQRFVELDIQFPKHFEHFVLVANCDFWQVQKSYKNLFYIISSFQEKPDLKPSGTVKDVFAAIRSHCGCANKAIIPVICKLRLEGTVPKFEDIVLNVASHIGQLPGFSARYLPELVEAAKNLINVILEASALTCHLPLRTHIIFATDPADALTKVTIEKKRITAALVRAAIETALQQAAQLQTATSVDVSNLPTGQHVLEKKMAAGGISFQSIDAAKDHHRSAEFILQNWLHKYGLQSANQRFEQLSVIVNTQCAEAFDAVYSETDLFGSPMLTELRSRLREITKDDSESIFKTRYEQLLGIASIATENCKVWWSKKFDLESTE